MNFDETVSLRLSKQQRAALAQIAQAEQRSMSNAARWLLDQALAARRQPATPAQSPTNCEVQG